MQKNWYLQLRHLTPSHGRLLEIKKNLLGRGLKSLYLDLSYHFPWSMGKTKSSSLYSEDFLQEFFQKSKKMQVIPVLFVSGPIDWPSKELRPQEALYFTSDSQWFSIQAANARKIAQELIGDLLELLPTLEEIALPLPELNATISFQDYEGQYLEPLRASFPKHKLSLVKFEEYANQDLSQSLGDFMVADYSVEGPVFSDAVLPCAEEQLSYFLKDDKKNKRVLEQLNRIRSMWSFAWQTMEHSAFLMGNIIESPGSFRFWERYGRNTLLNLSSASQEIEELGKEFSREADHYFLADSWQSFLRSLIKPLNYSIRSMENRFEDIISINENNSLGQ